MESRIETNIGDILLRKRLENLGDDGVTKMNIPDGKIVFNVLVDDENRSREELNELKEEVKESFDADLINYTRGPGLKYSLYMPKCEAEGYMEEMKEDME
jgi:hypothetical protein